MRLLASIIVEDIVVRLDAPETKREAVVRRVEKSPTVEDTAPKNLAELTRVASMLVDETLPKNVVADTLVASIFVEDTLPKKVSAETYPVAPQLVLEPLPAVICPTKFDVPVAFRLGIARSPVELFTLIPLDALTVELFIINARLPSL